MASEEDRKTEVQVSAEQRVSHRRDLQARVRWKTKTHSFFLKKTCHFTPTREQVLEMVIWQDKQHVRQLGWR